MLVLCIFLRVSQEEDFFYGTTVATSSMHVRNGRFWSRRGLFHAGNEGSDLGLKLGILFPAGMNRVY